MTGGVGGGGRVPKGKNGAREERRRRRKREVVENKEGQCTDASEHNEGAGTVKV